MFLGAGASGMRIAVLGMLGICPALIGVAKAEIVYWSPLYLSDTPIGPFNYVPLANDGTPNRPIGFEVGNTITLGGTDRLLNSVYLGLFDGGGAGDFTLYLYGGSDPNTAPLLGSATASLSAPIDLNVKFDFSSQHINLPNSYLHRQRHSR